MATGGEPIPNRRIPRTKLAAAAIALVAFAGSLTRDSLPFQPDDGFGYWLGVAGATMMVVLLVYPLSKRRGFLLPGSTGFWFRFHMVMGIAGPLAILFHARFTWRAINSGVALAAMLTVFTSGLIGRYLQLHVYRGYSLRHVAASELFDEAAAALLSLDADGDTGEEVHAELAGLLDRVRETRVGFLRSIDFAVRFSVETMLRRQPLLRKINDQFERNAVSQGWSQSELAMHRRDARRHLGDYLQAIRNSATYAVFDRLFAMWHHLHMPLYMFLVVASVAHIVAVHLY